MTRILLCLSARNGSTAKTSNAYFNPKCVADSSTLAWTMKVFLRRHNDCHVRSTTEFISKCFGLAKVNLKFDSMHNFWNSLEVNVDP